jgi:drug/metabolite transporter (DMT)-like permease
MTKSRAAVELTFASALWGFGFVATIWALKSHTSAELLVLRFLIALVAGIPLSLWMCRKLLKGSHLHEIKIAFVPGVLLGAFLLLQTLGMETTTATKSGFITTLYVLFVPLANQILFKQRPKRTHYFYALDALLGTYFLMGADLSFLVKGDLLTLIAAVVGAFHIISIGYFAPQSRNSFVMNNSQSFWSLLFFIPFLFTQEKINVNFEAGLPLIGILFLGLGSSLLAFAIQIRTQKVISDELASQLFLLEAPFSFAFAFVFLGETLGFLQLFGALLILLSSFASIKSDH